MFDIADYFPSSYTMKRAPHGKDIWYVTGGDQFKISVTVSFDERGFRGGISTFGALIRKHKYEGRGWRKRLCEDAAAWLNATA